MSGLRSRAWYVLPAFAVLVLLFGIGDIIGGVTADPGITLGLTGLTLAELEAQGAAGYRMFDFATRAGGLHLVVIGLLAIAVALIPYRRGERWAWYVLWVLPIVWCLGVLALNLAFGVVEGQAPPPPMLSAPLLAVVTALALLVDRGRFFDRPAAWMGGQAAADDGPA